MKRIMLTLLLTAMWIFSCSTPALAQEEPPQPEVVITFFWRDGCSHCAAEKPFLQDLAAQFPQIDLKAYEVYIDSANRDYLYALGEVMGFETTGVPVTVIGEQVWTGFSEDDKGALQAAVESCLVSGCSDPAEKFGLDLSGTTRTWEAAEENRDSRFTWWVIAAFAVVVLSYILGVVLRQKKEPVKKKQKKH